MVGPRAPRRLSRLWMLVALVATLGAIAAVDTIAAPAASSGCSYNALVRPFLLWFDSAYYTQVPGGTFEGSKTSWKLTGNARVVPGNETFFVNSAKDTRSLSVPGGSTATSPALCVSQSTPSIRLFAINTGASGSSLNIDVGVVTTGGTSWTEVASFTALTTGWWPTPLEDLNLPQSVFGATGTAQVSFRFSPQGSGGGWRIDDVYLDPFKRT